MKSLQILDFALSLLSRDPTDAGTSRGTRSRAEMIVSVLESSCDTYRSQQDWDYL